MTALTAHAAMWPRGFEFSDLGVICRLNLLLVLILSVRLIYIPSCLLLWKPGVLTIYTENPEIPVGNSNGSKPFHSEDFRNYGLRDGYGVIHIFHSF